MYFWRSRSLNIMIFSDYHSRLSKKKYEIPAVFLQAYPGSADTIITKENYEEFLLGME